MENGIRLSDGTELDGCGAGWADGNLWIYPEGITMKEAAALFLEETKTAVIEHVRDGQTMRYEGFTDCWMLNATPWGVRVMMTGGTPAADAAET